MNGIYFWLFLLILTDFLGAADIKKNITIFNDFKDCYEPDTRAGESAGNPNPYPNQKLFDAIEKFRKLRKIKERGGVKPGHWTEVKINQELEKKKQTEKKDMKNMFG